jgi:hypothetical protein
VTVLVLTPPLEKTLREQSHAGQTKRLFSETRRREVATGKEMVRVTEVPKHASLFWLDLEVYTQPRYRPFVVFSCCGKWCWVPVKPQITQFLVDEL